jgi:hypothetical protein
MNVPTQVDVSDIDVLARSFGRHLRALNRSKATVALYLSTVEQFAAFLRANGMPTTVDR